MPLTREEALDYPGREDYARPRRFFENRPFGNLEPRQDVLVDAAETVRAAAVGEELLVYVPDSRSVALDADALGPPSASWFDPATGRKAPASASEEGDAVRIEEPPWSGDAVAVVGR